MAVIWIEIIPAK